MRFYLNITPARVANYAKGKTKGVIAVHRRIQGQQDFRGRGNWKGKAKGKRPARTFGGLGNLEEQMLLAMNKYGFPYLERSG